MKETKRFDLGAVLCISTGRLVGRQGMDDVYEILNWMTDDNLFTHQLPRAMDECQPWLFEQFPELKDARIDAALAELDMKLAQTPNTKEACGLVIAEWLNGLTAWLPTTFEIPRMPDFRHKVINPIEELVSMTDKPIIAVKAPSAPESN